MAFPVIARRHTTLAVPHAEEPRHRGFHMPRHPRRRLTAALDAARAAPPGPSMIPRAPSPPLPELPPARFVGTLGLDRGALQQAHEALKARKLCERPMPWPSGKGTQARFAPWYDNVPYQAKLDAETNSTAYTGNRTRILVDGPESFAQKIQNIRSADVIFLKIYQWDDDASGRKYAAELEAAAQRGARVFVQYGVKSFYGESLKGLATLSSIARDAVPPVPPVLRNLAQCKNAVLAPNDKPSRWYSPHDLLLRRDHEKYIITWRAGDAVRLIMGGMNISDAWMHGGDASVKPRPKIQYRDTDVEIIGPAAKEAILEFMADWAFYDPEQMRQILKNFDEMSQTSQNILYPPSEENAVVRIVRNRPRHDDCAQYIKKLYIALLRQVPAGEEVHIENAYLLPSPDVRNALIGAANRGVKISMVTNAPCVAESEGSLLGKVSHALFRDLIRRCKQPQNFRFFEFVGNRDAGHNAMHQKIASFGNDGPYVIGSSNLDPQSLRYNKEIVAVIFDARGRADFDRMWRRDTTEHHLDSSGRVVGDVRELTHAFLLHERVRRKLRAKALYGLKHWL